MPSVDEMMRDIEKKKVEIEKRYFKGPRHTMQIDWVNFMDEIAQQYGAKPNLWKYFFSDPKFWYKLYFGPCLPYQYRLTGPHPWSGARDAIMDVEERIDAAFRTRKCKASETPSSSVAKSFYSKLLSLLSSILFVYGAYLKNYLGKRHWHYLAGSLLVLAFFIQSFNFIPK